MALLYFNIYITLKDKKKIYLLYFVNQSIFFFKDINFLKIYNRK